jgi:hypothetical protein
MTALYFFPNYPPCNEFMWHHIMFTTPTLFLLILYTYCLTLSLGTYVMSVRRKRAEFPPNLVQIDILIEVTELP